MFSRTARAIVQLYEYYVGNDDRKEREWKRERARERERRQKRQIKKKERKKICELASNPFISWPGDKLNVRVVAIAHGDEGILMLAFIVPSSYVCTRLGPQMG